MNHSVTRIAATLALSLLAAAGAARAEDYQGVQRVEATSQRSRAEVNAEAVATARATDQNVTRGSRGAEAFQPRADRGDVRAEATLAVRTGKLTAWGEAGQL